MRLAKIVATLGPATQTREALRELILAGVNVFRLNFSHANHEALTLIVKDIRELSEEMVLPVGILADLQGPKFRVGEMENHQPVLLETGSAIIFSAENTPGSATHITTNTPQIVEELNVGDDVLLDDGNLTLTVIERVSSHQIKCLVVMGGMLGEKKGINVPGLKMANLAALTEKDKIDARFALTQDVDFMALSFVRSAGDMETLRQFLEENLVAGKRIPLMIAKIEKPQALDEIDAIIAAADGIMVARGDLGVELRPEKVPAIQKMLIRKANEAEKPVITATQMLESMTQAAKPTRAEVSDVANAVFDGSDALMLSGETAVGKFPVAAVRMMADIIEESEAHYQEWVRRPGPAMSEDMLDGQKALPAHQAIAQAACEAAISAGTRAIVVLSFSGRMARRIAKRKPMRPIIALTPHKKVYRTLNLLGGVYPVWTQTAETMDDTLRFAEQAILDKGYLVKMDPVVFCAGETHLPGMTNTLKIYPFGDILQQNMSVNRPAAVSV